MRTIATASLAKLDEKTGTEPVCLVEIHWQSNVTQLYGDKDVQYVGGSGVDGRILQISEFDDTLNISKSTTTQTVSVTLDDSDGAIKQLFNNVDMHKRRATIYQWFTGLPISEKFVLFSGVIASPVIWKEGDRTLTFTIISKGTDTEVGFSPEEGQFPNLPEGMVGQVWPLVFGTVCKLPIFRIDEIPHKDGTGDIPSDSTTQGDHGIEDPAIEPHTKDQDKNADYASQLAKIYFVGYLQASFTARKLGELDEFDDIDKGKGTYSQLAKQYLELGNKYLKEAEEIKKKNSELKTVLGRQKSFNKRSIPISNGHLFKQGVNRNVKIGQGIYTGQFIGNEFQITQANHPELEKYQDVPDVVPDSTDSPVYLDRDAFFWNPAGQRLATAVIAGEIRDDPDSIRYIVAGTIQVTVRLVYAMRDIDGQRQLSIVPNNLYTVFQVAFGTLPVTMILVEDALSSLTDDQGNNLGWDDELYVTCTSPIGPNTVTILEWLIGVYTQNGWDTESFGQVATYLDAYPSNFALRSRPNIMALLQDIAYQSRCVIWLKDNVFHLKYLSRKDTPVATLTEADIIEQTLEVSYTETEDLITKVKASWRPDYQKQNSNLVILRYNILYYGLHEVSKDYYIYNQQPFVEKSAVFWLIRDSNTFKRVTCKIPIRFLNIETLDTVTLNFSHSFIANTAIDCVVESAILNTTDYTISLTLWVPVRAGEMTEYLFAFPGSLLIQYFWPTELDVTTGRAGGGNEVPLNNNVELPRTGDTRIDKPMSGDQGNGGQMHTTKRPLTWGTDPTYFGDSSNVDPGITQRIDETIATGMQAKKPSGTKTYQLGKSQVKDHPVTISSFTTCFPAKVIDGGPGQGPYRMEVYLQGTDGQATIVEEVYQLQIMDDDQVPADVWCFVNRVVFEDDEKKTQIKWYIQLPVWL